MGPSLIDIFERIAQAGGIAGLFALVIAFACWKLYHDLMRCKDARVSDLKKVSKETNETLRRLDRLIDRLYDWLLHGGR